MTELRSRLVTRTREADQGLIEFVQKYADGQRVCKRGLDATPMVVRKYAIREREVMTFSNHERRKRSLTAFHFHPHFPESQRRPYMEAHRDGYELALEVEAQRKSLARDEKAKWASFLRRTGKSVAFLLPALVIFSITHPSDS